MENNFDFKENRIQLLPKNRNIMESFKKKTYVEAFETYMEEMTPVFETMERACIIGEEEKETIFDLVIDGFLEDMEKETKNLSKRKKNVYLDNIKMTLALYTIPMILELQKDISEEFCNRFLDKWIKTYPDYVFLKGTYTDLVKGFDKRLFSSFF